MLLHQTDNKKNGKPFEKGNVYETGNHRSGNKIQR